MGVFQQETPPAQLKPGFLPACQRSQHGFCVHRHFRGLRTRERRRWLPVHGLRLPGDIWNCVKRHTIGFRSRTVIQLTLIPYNLSPKSNLTPLPQLPIGLKEPAELPVLLAQISQPILIVTQSEILNSIKSFQICILTLVFVLSYIGRGIVFVGQFMVGWTMIQFLNNIYPTYTKNLKETSEWSCKITLVFQFLNMTRRIKKSNSFRGYWMSLFQLEGVVIYNPLAA